MNKCAIAKEYKQIQMTDWEKYIVGNVLWERD